MATIYTTITYAPFPQDILAEACKKAGCIKRLMYIFRKMQKCKIICKV
jgi:pentatricopeptide repeat protein